jgi:hypothetical protein
MFTSYRVLAIPAVLQFLAGCVVEQSDPEDVGVAESAVLTTNTLTTNTLTTNTLTTNTLTTNTLTTNTLTTNGLGSQVVTALQDTTPVGAANRTVFHYLVTCALDPTQSVTYTWSDGESTNTVTEVGQIGLAPQWATGPLRSWGQQLVSACVASRINYFGVTVPISVRNEVLAPTTSSAELADYPFVEGAFWGNLFTSTPSLSSCYDPANVENSRSDQRECATGFLDANGQIDPCGLITLTGSCADECAWFDPVGQFYVGCGKDFTLAAITTGLQ